MRRWLASVVAVALAGCFIAPPPIRFGEGKSEEQAQYQRANELSAPELAKDRAYAGDLRTAKVRVYADDDYRAQNLKWESTFGETIDHANEVLGPAFGLRLVAEYHAWDRHATSSTLDEDLEELARMDRGDGALTVIGLTSSRGLTEATFDHLGLGSLPGRYMMLRGYADVEEHAVLEATLGKLSADDRQRLYGERRRHKTTAVFLHELGHNLGAPHEDDADTIMNAMYSHKSTAFSAHAHSTMLALLDQRLGGKAVASRGGIAHELPGAAHTRHTVVHVEIDASGEVSIDGDTVQSTDLGFTFAGAFKSDHDVEVVVTKAKQAPSKFLIDVMDRAKAAGIQHISIAAAPSEP